MKFAKFSEALDALADAKFIWGDHDCLFGLVVPVVEAATGRAGVLKKFRGRYKTARGALAIMKRNNFANLADLVASEFPEIHPSEIRMGDIAAIATDDDFAYSMGICNGQRVFVLHPDGLATRDLSEVVRAFRVE
jgi:hypothetical protein